MRSAEKPVTGDLNTTFGHRPIHIRSEAAAFIPNSSLEAALSFVIKGRPAPLAAPAPFSLVILPQIVYDGIQLSSIVTVF